MNRFARNLVLASLLALPLGACGSMSDFTIDPSEWFAGDFFGNKKKLPGERRPVFPEGVPGVTRGVPPELMKGSQPQADDMTADISEGGAGAPRAAPEEEPKPKAKPKPKPKVAAKPAQPRSESRPTSVTVRRSDTAAEAQPPAASQWPDPPPPRSTPQSSASQWPDPPAPGGAQSGVQWPDPPSAR